MNSIKQSADTAGARFGLFIGFLSLFTRLMFLGMDDLWLSVLLSVSIALCFGYGLSFAVFVYEYRKVRGVDLHLIWGDYEYLSDMLDDSGKDFSELMKSYREARAK